MDPMQIDRTELIQIFSAESEENLREMELGYVCLLYTSPSPRDS